MDRQIISAKELHQQFAADFQTVVEYAAPVLVGLYEYQFGQRTRITDTVAMLAAREPALASIVRTLNLLGEHDEATAQVRASLASLHGADEYLFLPSPTVAECAWLYANLHGPARGLDGETMKYHWGTAERAGVDGRRHAAYQLRHRILASGRTPPEPGETGAFDKYTHTVAP